MAKAKADSGFCFLCNHRDDKPDPGCKCGICLHPKAETTTTETETCPSCGRTEMPVGVCTSDDCPSNNEEKGKHPKGGTDDRDGLIGSLISRLGSLEESAIAFRREQEHTPDGCQFCWDIESATEKLDELGRDMPSEAKPFAPTDVFDLTNALMEYEAGDMDEPDMVKLFQYLVDTGLAWTFQGHYGRTATTLIEQGLVKRKGE